MVNYEELNNFIIKVFNYYNGKINVINRAVLDINWCNLIGYNITGHSCLPNIVSINPMVIIRTLNYNMYSAKATIVLTIIHELYHIDQAIDYHMYTIDDKYKDLIENSCELQTIIYMLGHIQEIYNNFGVKFNKDRYIEANVINKLYYPGVRYERRTVIRHIFMYFNMLLHDENDRIDLRSFIENTINNNKNITLYINDKIINIYNGGKIISIDEFNKNVIPFNRLINKFEFDIRVDFDNDKNLFILFNIINKIEMCDITKQNLYPRDCSLG